MCNGGIWRSLRSVHTVSPLSPPSPSLRSIGGRRSPSRFGQSRMIPQVLFIPIDLSFGKSADPPHLPMRSEDDPEPWSATRLEDERDGKSSKPPHIPRRQQSIEYDLDTKILAESAKSSPRLPSRKVSVSNFEEWLEEGSDSGLIGEQQENVAVRSPDGRRHSFPARGPPNHFQYIVDRNAGGNCPKLPKRCKSNRKTTLEPRNFRKAPQDRAASGHF